MSKMLRRYTIMLLMVLGGLIYAQSTAALTLPSPAHWLAAGEDTLVVLGDDGTVTRLTPAGREVLATGWQGDQVQLCGARVLGVNAAGRLTWAGEDLVGPKVAVHAVPACLQDGGVLALSPGGDTLLRLSPRLERRAQVRVNALPDAHVVLAELNGDTVPEAVLLTGPTERYPHGVLGDALEATSLSVLNSQTLERLSSYTLDESYVFEQRRVVPYQQSLLATRASPETGAGVIRLEWRDGTLVLADVAEPIGQGFRWLNLFTVASETAYAVHTPHIGGPLQRYDAMDKLSVTEIDLGITNHVIGSRNLDLGTLLSVQGDIHHLVFPDLSLSELRLVRCTGLDCEVTHTLPLNAPLSSNTVYLRWQGADAVAAADEGGNVLVWCLGMN